MFVYYHSDLSGYIDKKHFATIIKDTEMTLVCQGNLSTGYLRKMG
jgi:hypothetical protein